MTTPAYPDSFGSAPGAPIMTDPATGLTYTLGFSTVAPGVTPAPIWTLIATWGRAKGRLGPTWATAKARSTTWGMAKAVAGG